MAFCTISLFAQEGQEFTGRVTDSTGASVPKAAIIVHNLLTNVDVTTVTTGTGDNTVPYIKPGSYQITAVAPGFKKEIRSGFTLQVGQVSTVSFKLSMGATSESVTVVSNSIVDFGKAVRGGVVENTRVTELTLNGRDPDMLSILDAGTTWTGSIQWERPTNRARGWKSQSNFNSKTEAS